MDFDVTCTDEQLKEQAHELRELAGAIGTESASTVTNNNIRVYLDASKVISLLNDNYSNIEQIKVWLAEWVPKRTCFR